MKRYVNININKFGSLLFNLTKTSFFFHLIKYNSHCLIRLVGEDYNHPIRWGWSLITVHTHSLSSFLALKYTWSRPSLSLNNHKLNSLHGLKNSKLEGDCMWEGKRTLWALFIGLFVYCFFGVFVVAYLFILNFEISEGGRV